MKNNFCISGLAVVMAILTFVSCDITPGKDKEGPSSGRLQIGVDNSYTHLMDAEISLYSSLNPNTEIEGLYLPEAEVMDLLLKDSIRAAVVSRDLTEQEEAYYKSIQRSPKSTLIAIDGVALIVNPANPDTVLTIEQVRNIFKGKDSLWTQLNPKSTNTELRVVFDNNKSSNARFLREKFELDHFPDYCFAVDNNEEVINYVNEHKNAIGVISVSWLADDADSLSLHYRSMVRAMGIIDESNVEDPQMPRTPHQAYIYDRSYPLRRDVYYIHTGLRSTLGTGFGNYLAGEKGQLLIQRTGMIAAKTPQRLIRLTD